MTSYESTCAHIHIWFTDPYAMLITNPPPLKTELLVQFYVSLSLERIRPVRTISPEISSTPLLCGAGKITELEHKTLQISAGNLYLIGTGGSLCT